MTNKLTKEKIRLVVETLVKRGFELMPVHPYADPDRFSLKWPSKYRETYLGTFLNGFSCILPDEPELWSDERAYEYPEVQVSPVYRHNGAKEDVSLEVAFIGWHTSVREFPEKWKYDAEKPRYVEAVRKGSPVNYLEEGVPLSVCTSGKQVRLAKLTAKSGAKAVANAVEKAVAACEDFVPNDHSKWAKDPRDYHPDTQAEHDRWMAESKRRRGLGV